jgi:hypothetical protein
VQMQFNYYHYGVWSSQSPTTPDTVSRQSIFSSVSFVLNSFRVRKHTRRKRRKVDPNYREKMEMLRAQATAPAPTAPAAKPDSTSCANAPVLSHNTQQPPAPPELNLTPAPSSRTAIEKDGDLEEEKDEPPPSMTVRISRGFFFTLDHPFK